jgi:Protein of unknown function (DUF3775)
MPDPNEILEISASKVAHVISRSRETGVNTGDWDEDADLDADATAEEEEAFLETPPDDPARQELRDFLNLLTREELASLIALAWIGRGTYAPGELDEAISAAKAAHATNGAAYLFSLALLPDYLEDALEQLGVSVI